MTQEEIVSAFRIALGDENFHDAHDLVVRIQDNEQRVSLYKEFFEAARASGECGWMTMTAPFAAHNLALSDFKECSIPAHRKKDLRNIIECRKRFADPLDGFDIENSYIRIGEVFPRELQDFPELSGPMLMEIIRKHVPDWKLTDEELFMMWILRLPQPQ